jgi:hypothetical protein
MKEIDGGTSITSAMLNAISKAVNIIELFSSIIVSR